MVKVADCQKNYNARLSCVDPTRSHSSKLSIGETAGEVVEIIQHDTIAMLALLAQRKIHVG